jgi:UDP-N-acetylmuramate: L-alanyl-gamma-D-glutamyl-meso-diaminopimelate ligase
LRGARYARTRENGGWRPCDPPTTMRIHLIATGGAIMHNLAIALHKKGYKVTGSDDLIYEPARSRLTKYGLLPEEGWNADHVTHEIDLVILGMHAKPDNPELLKARELGLPIQSFPEFIFNESGEKKRVVVAGSHGKTTVTSMIMHALKKKGVDFDYAVGSTIAGFEDSVSLSEGAPLIIIEGDEYLSSPIDRKPKFLWYKPQLAIVNGIAWDHINVFPTYEMYKEQFALFLKSMEAGAKVFYPQGDDELETLMNEHGRHLQILRVSLLDFKPRDDKTVVTVNGIEKTISVFGRHNMLNLAVAQKICAELGVSEEEYWESMGAFTGAGKRLERVPAKEDLFVFRDFAHAPSKVKATVEAVREQFASKKLIAILELHTFSSLNPEFIKGYRGSLDPADKAYVYVDKDALAAKGGKPYTAGMVREAFESEEIIFLEEPGEMEKAIKENTEAGNVLLLMSSGQFGGVDLRGIFES